MPAEGRENPLLKKGNSDAFFREKYLTKNNGVYQLDHAVTATQKTILKAFGLNAENVRYRAAYISEELKK